MFEKNTAVDSTTKESIVELSKKSGVTRHIKSQQRRGLYLNFKNLRYEDSTQKRIELEVLENSHPFRLVSWSVDEGFIELDSVVPQSKHIVREYDNLVGSLFVVLNQELARSKLVRVHCVQQLRKYHSQSKRIICNQLLKRQN